jgi:hypothetical protein
LFVVEVLRTRSSSNKNKNKKQKREGRRTGGGKQQDRWEKEDRVIR